MIELLIVIGILGVLAGIVVFAVGGFSNAGEEEACKTNRKSVITALEAFKARSSNWTHVSGITKGYPLDESSLEDAEFIVEWPNGWGYTPLPDSVADGQVQNPETAVTYEIVEDYNLTPPAGSPAGC